MLCLLAPQLFQARIAPTGRAVEVIAQRVLMVVILMIVLGGIEGLARQDFSHDGVIEAAGIGQLLARCFQ